MGNGTISQTKKYSIPLNKGILQVEEEPMNLPVLLTEDSSSALLEAHVLQLDGGTLAYIHSQPQGIEQEAYFTISFTKCISIANLYTFQVGYCNFL